MVDRKQSMKTPEPLMIQEKDLQEVDVRVKNMLQAVPTVNRGPKPSRDEDYKSDGDESKSNQNSRPVIALIGLDGAPDEQERQLLKEVRIIEDAQIGTGTSKSPADPSNAYGSQEALFRNHESVPQISIGGDIQELIGRKLDSMHQMQSQNAIGISTLQLEPTEVNSNTNTVSKRPSRLSNDRINRDTGKFGKQGGLKSPTKGSPKSLVARI